jgi:hypothetical protein
MAEEQNQDRTRIITRYMGLLQGLKAIPFGLLLFVLAAQDIGLLGEAGNCAVSLPLFLSMLIMLFVIDTYYVNQFGRIKPINRRAQIHETTIFLSLFALLIVLENWLSPPFSLLSVAVGALFIQTGLKSKRYHYLPLAAVVIVGAFLAWFQGVPLNDPFFGSLGIMFKVLIGTVIMLAGIIDHFLMMRALRTV